MFAIVNMMRINGVELSKKSKCAKKNCNFERFEKHVKSYIHCERYVGNDGLNYFCHS